MTFLFVMLACFISIAFAFYLRRLVKQMPDGDHKMREIAAAIREGSYAYLKRQYRTVGAVALILFVVLWLAFGSQTALGFLIGALFSGLAGFIGMQTAVLANVRTAEAAKKSLNSAFIVAFRGGGVTGFLVAGTALLSV